VSKKYLAFSSEYLTIWESEQTISIKYLSEYEVFVLEKDKEILAYYSIANFT
jgi:hypothetical protein